jgi:two-component system phosphate regulon sensor histidine kinase PhoR
MSAVMARTFGVVVQPRTYANLLFLATRTPVGMLYFVFLLTGLATGVGLLVVVFGVVVLAVTMVFAWLFAVFERDLACWWLGVSINPMRMPGPPAKGFWSTIGAHLRNPVTWKSLGYLALQLPLGALVFLIIESGLGLALSLVVSPLVVIEDVGTYNQGIAYHGPLLDFLHGGALISELPLSLLLVLLGLLVIFLVLHGTNLVATAWGELARALLGVSDAKLQLAAARDQAAVEHSRAVDSDQRRRDLVVNVSHELRTPIASIRGHVETLRAPEGERPPGVDDQQYLDVISREVDRLNSLVDDLLIVARGEAGELKLAVVPVDAAEVVAQVKDSLAPIASRDRLITLTVLPTGEVPRVLADASRLEQVLTNLVRNAITNTPQGGVVSMRVQTVDANHVAITVADTGLGMSEQELSMAFERFYRSDASRARATGGFGLGLPIANELIAAMGGSITASSKVGEGSQFHVYLRRA